MKNQDLELSLWLGEQLQERVYQVLVDDLKHGDGTVLYELLSFVPYGNLVQSLPEEEWEEYGFKLEVTK